ncbi:MAG: hypothetical protein Q8P81_03615 [Nanoarchaeota archaeon]|nr:hypothetical protein [Nanoarchaeota archaeon]
MIGRLVRYKATHYEHVGIIIGVENGPDTIKTEYCVVYWFDLKKALPSLPCDLEVLS